jgi:carbamoyltransferase
MKTLGMNTQHDGGCCLVVDGEIVCAISEEKLTRKKGAAGWWYSMRYCLETARVSLSEIDLAVFSSYTDNLPNGYDGGLTAFGLRPGRTAVVDHHLSHAASSFFLSPFDDALIVVLDGTGNCADTESYYIAEGTEITRIGGNLNRVVTRGVGKTYEAFTSFLGWGMLESGTTMALAAYGSPDRFSGIELYEVKRDQINSYLREKYLQGVLDFARRNDVDFGRPFERGATQTSCDVAYFVQNRTEQALIQLISNLLQQHGQRRLCLSGGVALNCVANEKLRKCAGVEDLFVMPAASDKGQPIGNAVYGYTVLLRGGRVQPLFRDSFGRSYTQEEIHPVLSKRQEIGNNFIVEAPPIGFERVASVESEVARLLADGKTVGWMQGGSEMGPRALGHRSILADPRRFDIQKHLNEKIKHREWFRPYAPAVLQASAELYFDIDVASPFMLLATKVWEERAVEVPGVVHIDGTSRPQTVSSTAEPRLHRVISAFEALTGIPLVLNTSFNLSGEPMVETPRDALSAFLRTGLDFLVIEDYLIWKEPCPWRFESPAARVSEIPVCVS